MRKVERASEIVRLARSMAGPGVTFRSIELKLRVQFPEARTVLDDAFLRKEIKMACEGLNIYNV
jgi:hypothetical protein